MKTKRSIKLWQVKIIVSKLFPCQEVFIGVAFFALMFILPMKIDAIHSPAAWYELSPDDVNGNKVEDIIDAMDPDSLISVFVCFLNDCRPELLLNELVSMGSLGYLSTVVSSAVVSNITVGNVVNLIASWPEVGYIHLNRICEPHMTTAGQALKAHKGYYSPSTAEDYGKDGDGVTIAILDTGVDDPGGPGSDPTHNHLPSAVGGLFLTNCDPFIWTSCTLNQGNPDDELGHGTAVAGCALGRGDASGNNRGIAPKASLFDCRITPPGPWGRTSSDNIQQVVDWLTWNHTSISPPLRVANLSFGSNYESAGDALTYSIEALVASGVVVCVSAGNHDACTEYNGRKLGIGNIAVASRAITVAAASHENTIYRGDDVIADYSRIGPGIGPSPKPDITAYGNQCPIDCDFPGFCAGPSSSVIRAPEVNTANGYRDFGGTSAASPMVAGAAALIIQWNPDISPAAVKRLLMDNAEDMGPSGWDEEWGAGLMDLGSIFIFGTFPLCDLAVISVNYYTESGQVECCEPVTIEVVVKNVGDEVVNDFSVDWERWYFGPNSAPAQRFPIGAGPEPIIKASLHPGDTRSFTRTWTPGISDKLPLSKHSCFWGIVHAACDINFDNNELHHNFTIADLSQGEYDCHCTSSGKIAKLHTNSDPFEFPFRIGHKYAIPVAETLKLVNSDLNNWHAELDVNGVIDESQLIVTVDNQQCPDQAILRVYPYDPENRSPVEFHVYASSVYGNMGEMHINHIEGANCDVTGEGQVNVLDILAIVNHILGIQELDPVALVKADCNGDGQINVLDALGCVNVILGAGECVPTTSKFKLTPEVMEFMQLLEPHLSAENFVRLMALVKTEIGVPTEYNLVQNFPNPFNPVTTIEYTLPEAVRVKVEVYNLLGQVVDVLVDSEQEAGFHTVQWDATDMASGVYFYRLETGNFTATKRMVLMK